MHSRDFTNNFRWKGALIPKTASYGDGVVFTVDPLTCAAGELQILKVSNYITINDAAFDAYGALYYGGAWVQGCRAGGGLRLECHQT